MPSPVNEIVRPVEPVTDLQPHLRAVADKSKSGEERTFNMDFPASLLGDAR